MSLNMNENIWERQVLDQVRQVINLSNQTGLSSRIEAVEQAIDMAIASTDTLEPELRTTFRKLCFAAAEGDSRAWLLVRLRDEVCTGMFDTDADQMRFH
jgi:hypothetical protein